MIRMRNFKFAAVVMFCLLGSFTSKASAQTQNASAGTMTSQNGDAKIEQDANGALYLDFKGASLLNVLNSLSQVSKINFVAGSEIAKREVNMSLDGVTLEQALQAISNGSNVTYAFMPESNIVMFRASSDAPQLAPLYTRIFKLYYLRATKVKEIDAGKSSSGNSGSSGSSGGGGALELISSGDKSSGTQTTEAAILAILQKMISERGSVAVDDRSNSLVATDTEDRLDRIATVIAELDRPLNQVLISVILLETFEDLDRQLGVEWANSTTSPGVFGTVTGGKTTSRFPFNLGDTGKVGLGSVFGANPNVDALLAPASSELLGVKDFSTLNVQVKALQSASKLRILAKPNILVMDNHPAIVKIVTNAAIGTQTVVGSAGGSDKAATSSTSTGAERAEVGTILRVTPLINSQDQITMTIEPTFATVDTSGIAIGGGKTGDPTIRAARTTVMVKSGQTLVMGGMMFSNQQDADRKTPFLADVPLLGRLFTSDQKTIQDRELVLFLSPQIVKNPAALDPGKIPTRYERFDDVNAQFWKYRKKTWYKNVSNPQPAPAPYEQYFNVRESAMDQMAGQLQSGKDDAMKKEFQKAGQPSELKWEVH